jgi:hypothetical protein
MSDSPEITSSNQGKKIQVRFGNGDLYIDGGRFFEVVSEHLPGLLRPRKPGESTGLDPMRLAVNALIAKELPKFKRQIAQERPGYPLPDPPRHIDLLTYLLDYLSRMILDELAETVIVLDYRRAAEYGPTAVEIVGARAVPLSGEPVNAAPTARQLMAGSNGHSDVAELGAAVTGIEPGQRDTETAPADADAIGEADQGANEERPNTSALI